LLFFKNHFEGGYLFRDMVTLEATPPQMQDGGWRIQYRFENQREKDWQDANVRDDAEVLTFEIPVEQTTPPGIRARLHVETRFWNEWQVLETGPEAMRRLAFGLARASLRIWISPSRYAISA